MGQLLIYVDTSVIGGCEDPNFSKDSLVLWEHFVSGGHRLALSALTLREIQKAPENVRRHLLRVPSNYQELIDDSREAEDLADTYLSRSVLGPGSRSDALHVALATIGHADVLVSWNFRHIVNLGRIRLFNSVNLERGYGMIEIRSPKEVLEYEEDL